MANPKMTTAELVEAVKRHAIEHYNEGWDVVHETYEDAELAGTIGRATTLPGALAKFSVVVDVWADSRAATAICPTCHECHMNCMGHDEPVPAPEPMVPDELDWS